MDDKIYKKISRRMTLDEDRNDAFTAYDDMTALKYDFPSGLAGRDDVMEFISPSAHDAEKVACNIFDTYNPKWDVLPYGPQDKDTAEERERWLEWQMEQANMRTKPEPFRLMMQHSLRYSMIAVQMDYLHYWKKDEELEEGGAPLARGMPRGCNW